MIKINLLPFRAARKKENIRRQISVFILSFILLIILVIVYHFNLGGKITDLKTRVEETNQKLATYDKINKEIAGIKKDLAVLNNKINVIKTLDLNREAPVRLLDEMTQTIVPKRMWFTSLEEKSIEGTQGKKIQAVTLRGYALDNKTVADFMTHLEASALFSSVNLITLKQDKKDSNLNLKSFEINCDKTPLKVNAETDQK